MAQTVEDLVELGLSKAEAERVVKRKEKAVAKNASAIALATKRLPKAQSELDHAKARIDHWTEVAKVAEAKVEKYNAIISGDDTSGEVPADTTTERIERLEEAAAETPAPAKKTASSRGKK